MRKYCRACGASLIVLDEEPKSEPEPVEALEELLAGEPEVETPSLPEEDEPLVRPSDIASSPEDEPLVRPSDVASEQAETVTIEETVEPPEPEEAPSETMDVDKGREVVQDILEKVRAAEARAADEAVSEEPEDALEPPPEPLEFDEPLVYEEPEVEPEVPTTEAPELPEDEVISVEEPSEVAEPTASAETAEVTSQPVETTDVPAKDEKVRTLESDISAYNIELAQLKTESDTLRTHLDEEVERYLTISEVKRTRVESIERELSLAKTEYSDANKDHKNVDNRRKKELSNSEKRIREVEKRIKKAEDSKSKRIQDLEKERRKREEEARK